MRHVPTIIRYALTLALLPFAIIGFFWLPVQFSALISDSQMYANHGGMSLGQALATDRFFAIYAIMAGVPLWLALALSQLFPFSGRMTTWILSVLHNAILLYFHNLPIHFHGDNFIPSCVLALSLLGATCEILGKLGAKSGPQFTSVPLPV